MQQAVTVQASDMAAIADELRFLREQVAELSEQTRYLAERARVREVKDREWDDFKHDFTPVANDLYGVLVEQLAELEPHVHLEDIVRLLKRLARNTRTLESMLDRLESANDFIEDAAPLTNDMFQGAVLMMADMEHKGYFGFARESTRIVDNIVTSFTEDDVRQLGDNVVLILNTVKEMTQPEVMTMVRNLGATYRLQVEEPDGEVPTSILSLLRQMRDPDVRRGLAITMNMLKVMARQQEGTEEAPVERAG